MENIENIPVENEVETIKVEEASKYMKVFNEVLDEVAKETHNRQYDEALVVPKMLKIILNKNCGREALKDMITYSQQPGYDLEWPRAKVYHLVRYLNAASLNPMYSGDSLTQEEFISVMSIFSLFKKQQQFTYENNPKTFVKKNVNNK